MIDAKFGKKDYNSIPVTEIGRGVKSVDVRTNLKPD
jgi:hypothetical protein